MINTVSSYRKPISAPTGSIVMFAASTIPDGWLLCNGAAVSRTTYSTLYALVLNTYGGGDGSTTFNLPDLRNKIPAGLGAASWSSSLAATGGSANAITVTHLHSMPHGHPGSGTPGGDGGHTHTARFLTTATGSGSNADLARPDSIDPNTGSFFPFSPGRTFNITSSQGGHNHTVSIAAFTGNTEPAGSSGTNANLPPYITLNFIIKT